MSSPTTKTTPSAPAMARDYLAELGRPAHFSLIWEYVQAENARLPKARRPLKGLTPKDTLSAQIILSTKRDGGHFYRDDRYPATFGLTRWDAKTKRLAPEVPDAVKDRELRRQKAAKAAGTAAAAEQVAAVKAAPKKRRAKATPKVVVAEPAVMPDVAADRPVTAHDGPIPIAQAPNPEDVATRIAALGEGEQPSPSLRADMETLGWTLDDRGMLAR